MSTISTLEQLAEHVGAVVHEGDTREAVMNRIRNRVYKDTSCGCSVTFAPLATFTLACVRGYCEGVEREFHPHVFTSGQTSAEWDKCVAAAEQDGQDAWDETHGCEGCGEPDPTTGYRLVRGDCPNCGGEGTIL